MDPHRGQGNAADLIWERNISAAIGIINYPLVKREYVEEALISAHRDRYDQYESNGNRDISAVGLVALTACIKYGLRKDGFKSRAPVWEKLKTHDNLLQIAASSNLKDWIVASIRQSDANLQVYLPKKVIAYALHGLIGAVYLSSERNLEATCNTIDALSRYLETEMSSGTSFALPTLTNPSNVESTISSTPPNHPFGTNLSIGTGPGDAESGGLNSLEDYYSNLDWIGGGLMWEDWSAGSPDFEPSIDRSASIIASPPPQSTQPMNLDVSPQTVYDYFPTDLTGLESRYGLHHPSVAHASTDGKQFFAVTVSHSVEQKLNPAIKPNRPSRHFVVPKKLKEYINNQNKLHENSHSNENFQWSPAAETAVGKLSKTPKHQIALLKLYHGSVSARAVIRIKNALASRRCAAPFAARLSGPVETPTQHYHIINQLKNSQAQNTIEMSYYIYKLYVSLRGDYISALDDGFIHSDPQRHSSALTVGGAPTAGNPIKKRLSEEYCKMLNRAESGWELMTKDEKTRLREFVERLRKLGERLHRFVNSFGIGVLCLLIFKEPEQCLLAVSQTEFCNLPDTEKKELDALIQLMIRCSHPIIQFAKTASPILEYIVGESLGTPGRFCCEVTETAAIAKMLEGSAELLAQLGNV